MMTNIKMFLKHGKTYFQELNQLPEPHRLPKFLREAFHMEANRIRLLITKYPLLQRHFKFNILSAPDQLKYNNPTGEVKEPITADLSDVSFETLTPELVIQLEDLCTDILDIKPIPVPPTPTPTLTITQDERTAMKKQLEDLKTEMDRKNAEKYIPLSPEEEIKMFIKPIENTPIPMSVEVK